MDFLASTGQEDSPTAKEAFYTAIHGLRLHLANLQGISEDDLHRRTS